VVGVLEVTSIIVEPEDLVTPDVYSFPPPCVPSEVVENLNGCEDE
jgi:hypothetical protein